MLLALLLPLLTACGGDGSSGDDDGADTPGSPHADNASAADATATVFTDPRPNTIGGGGAATSTAGTGTGADGHEHDHAGAAPEEGDQSLEVVLVPSELVVGPNRFAVGLLHDDGSIVPAQRVQLTYYDLSNSAQPVVESDAEATRLATPDNDVVIWAHQRDFARAGDWGVQVRATQQDGSLLTRNIAFSVDSDSSSLLPGEAAPRVDSPTLASVDDDLSRLTSASTPDREMYTQSIAEALDSGRPTLVLFATPAYCQTRFCGPDYEIARQLRETWGAALNVIHIEVYSGLPNPVANNFELAPAMTAFGVATEPWLYLIDADGVVTYRVEGLFTYAEVDSQISALLGQ